jgi:2'-5' RNA ligase
MRTFLALDLPEDVTLRLADLTEPLRAAAPHQVNWVAPQNHHITLQFIGDTNPADLPEISQFISHTISGWPALEFSHPRLDLVPGSNPRICWVALTCYNSALMKFVREFRNELKYMGYSIDSKPLKFHITLGRIKKRLPENLVHQILTTELMINTFRSPGITLYQSILRPEGPVYNPLAQYPL